MLLRRTMQKMTFVGRRPLVTISSPQAVQKFFRSVPLLPNTRNLCRTSRNNSDLGGITAKAMLGLDPSEFQGIKYSVKDKVAHIMLNRPERYNAIDEFITIELERAVELANLDDNVKVILLYGNKVFCSGYDLKKYAEAGRGSTVTSQEIPWDPYQDFKVMSRCTRSWMSLWHSHKPTICKIHGVAIGGGCDIALCCDVTFTSEDARIGYPPSRVWGCPTTAMWVYRVGMEKAKRILFKGQILSGREAADIGLIGEAVPAEDLDQAVDDYIQSIITVPTNQLFFQKQVINQAMEQMGVLNTQRIAVVFDGMSRHTPEGFAFQKRTQEVGFKQAVKERDSHAMAVWSDVGKDKSKL